VVITELAELDEQRAVPELHRIAQLEEGQPDRFGNTMAPLIKLARKALRRLRKI
jgi:hypothetical protein